MKPLVKASYRGNTHDFTHNVPVNFSKFLGVKKRNEALYKSFSTEALHMILCEEMTPLQGKTFTFFSF